MKRKEFIKYASLTAIGTFMILNPQTAQAQSHQGNNGNGKGWGKGGNPNNNGNGNSIWNDSNIFRD